MEDNCISSLCSLDKTVVSIFFDLQLPILLPNIFFCYSNYQGAAFFFFLLLLLPSSVLQWHHEEGNFFLKYDQSNWLFYVGYSLEVFSSFLYVQELVHLLLSLTFLSSTFSSSIIFQSSPNSSVPIFLVSISEP